MTLNRGAHVRAAQAWADLDDAGMANAIGVSKRTLSRLKGGADLSYERATAIAEATGVPGWFMASGFEGATAPDEPNLAERMEALEGRMDTLYRIAVNRIGADLGSLPGGPDADSEAEGSTDRPD